MRRTPLHSVHEAAGARLVEFAGWEMPLQYPGGILAEHLVTRERAGLFDVSHMGRFEVTGPGAVPFLRRVLSNDAGALAPGQSHYTLLPTPTGGALDDAWLCRAAADRWLLVVNAANREQDLAYLRGMAAGTPALRIEDITESTAMLSIQGPRSEAILAPLLDGGLPSLRRNACMAAVFRGGPAFVSRTGYTGEPVGFEVVVPAGRAGAFWEALTAAGAEPAGLGARDTLRLEAGLPLFGHELGRAADGSEIPILACPAARFGVSLAPERGGFVGREALAVQAAALASLRAGGPGNPEVLPRRIRCLAVADRGVARAGAPVSVSGRAAGHVTSGTMVPFRPPTPEARSLPAALRALALAYVDSSLRTGDTVAVRVRDRDLAARLVDRFLENRSGPVAVPVLGSPVSNP